MDLSKLYVITAISNPIRYESRYRLYRNFKKHMLQSGAKLVTVECAFGDRPHIVTQDFDKHDFQVRSYFELWYKENLLNVALSKLPPNAEYVLWIDADIAFIRPDWLQEAWHALQHYKVIQLFSHAVDLGPNFEPMSTHTGFIYNWIRNGCKPPEGCGYGGYGLKPKEFWHPGFCWGATREALDDLGGLIDWAVLGSGDHHMALGLIGEMDRSVPKNINDRYFKKLKLWEERANRYIQKDIGYVPGTIAHFWHGDKKKRYYRERWDIITQNNFDPDLDLKRDMQGLYQLTDRNPKLRDDIRAYFRARNEDGIDIL